MAKARSPLAPLFNRKVITDYHDVTVWGKNASVVHQYTTTGSLISVNGRLENDDYTDRKDIPRKKEYILGRKVELLETKKQTLAHKTAAREQEQATSTDDYRDDSTTRDSRDRPLGETDDADWFPY